MKLRHLLLTTAASAATTAPPLRAADSTAPLFENAAPPSSGFESRTHRIPTSYESAVLARRILHLTPLGTLSTVFPSSSSSSSQPPLRKEEQTAENRPPGVAGAAVGLMDYIADCEGAGDPTILAIQIATSFRNVRAGSSISLSLRWAPPYAPAKRIGARLPLLSALSGLLGLGGAAAAPEAVPYSAANLPRFSLMGRLERIEGEEAGEAVAACFVDKHPDARYWLPGNRIHASEWVRLVVTQVYWIGGFGDRAYIGWIPVEEWRNVTRAEWEDVRLPGEKKGWEEWAVGGWAGMEL